MKDLFNPCRETIAFITCVLVLLAIGALAFLSIAYRATDVPAIDEDDDNV